MAVLQPMPSVPISFTPPSVGPSLTQTVARYSYSRHESPLQAFGAPRSPQLSSWAAPSVMPLAQAASETSSMPAMQAVAPLPGWSSQPGWTSPRPSPPQVGRTLPVASSHPTLLSWSSLSLGVTEAASFGRAVSPSPLSSTTQTVAAPRMMSRSAASFGNAVSPSPLPSGAQTVMVPQMNSRGAFKFYGPNDFVERPDVLQASFGSFGLGFSVAPPAPEYQRERLVTEDTTLTNPPFEPSGMPSRIDQTQSSVLSNEYGPPPGSLPPPPPPLGQVSRQPTALVEEVAPLPVGPGLESQVQELLDAQRSMRQEISEMRGQVSTESTELEAMRSLPPPPDALQPAWQQPMDGQPLAGLGGYQQQQQPISPASAASYQQSPTGSPGSYQGPSPASGLPPPPDGSAPQSGSQRGFQSPQGPRAPPPEDPQVAVKREHMRMRNLGYHDNIDALNTMSTHVSTKARDFHSQLRAKSPSVKRPCC